MRATLIDFYQWSDIQITKIKHSKKQSRITFPSTQQSKLEPKELVIAEKMLLLNIVRLKIKAI
jgi:hypothetical protein